MDHFKHNLVAAPSTNLPDCSSELDAWLFNTTGGHEVITLPPEELRG